MSEVGYELLNLPLAEGGSDRRDAEEMLFDVREKEGQEGRGKRELEPY